MTASPRLARVLARRTASGIEFAIEDGEGEIFRVLATDDQIDDLVDTLDQLLDAADETQSSFA